MKRYSLWLSGAQHARVYDSDGGRWVLYDEAAAEIAARDARVAELEKALADALFRGNLYQGRSAELEAKVRDLGMDLDAAQAEIAQWQAAEVRAYRVGIQDGERAVGGGE